MHPSIEENEKPTQQTKEYQVLCMTILRHLYKSMQQRCKIMNDALAFASDAHF